MTKVTTEGIALNVSEIIPGPSQTRSPFVDSLESTNFFFKKQFDTKLNDKGEKKNTFGIVAFPKPVKAKVKDTVIEAVSIMADLSELLYIAERDGMQLLIDGKANPALELSINAGQPTLK